jgi:hypothetical protein
VSNNNWREVYWGGSAEAERVHFEKLAVGILEVQARVKKRSGAGDINRAFHAKAIVATANAELRFSRELAPEFRVKFADVGAAFPVTVRISNASGAIQSDKQRDLRGIALRVKVSDQEYHDLLMTNFSVPHARDAKQFVAFAKAMSGSRILGILKLFGSVGPFEAARMLRNVSKASKRPVSSVALESYWSRGAMLWGGAGPVRYFLRPVQGAQPANPTVAGDSNHLRSEIGSRLLNGDVVFDLCVQRYLDEKRTPIENASTEWKESDSPAICVAQVVIPKQDIHATEAVETARAIDAMAFNPWQTTDEFRPLGNINRARKTVYEASAAHRQSLRFYTEIPVRNKVLTAVLATLFRWANRLLPWHRMPSLSLQLLQLALFRHVLRQKNLIDSEPRPAPPQAQPTPPPPIREEVRTARTYDGTYNDLSAPNMGRVGAAFGRNLATQYLPSLLDVPNPLIVSRELLYRDHFIPASTLNILAAAWIQFQVHDWVQHARYPLGQNDISVALPAGMKWRNTAAGPEESVMRISRDRPIYQAAPGSSTPSLVFGNTTSHWWDGSEVYGTTMGKANSLRVGAKLQLDNGYLPVHIDGGEVTGFNESWWLGLSMLHTLFAREHNAVCDALRSAYATWSDERIYQTARLIVSALIAKIHTVEWTPAILATEAIDVGLNSSWFGAPNDWLTRLGLWLTDVHAMKGIPGTTPDHHTAPYALTEDFVTVYRLHPLLPDEYRLYHHFTGKLISVNGFAEIQGKITDEVMRDRGLENVLYSLGISHPGAITLHNYPRSLQEFERENGERIDLSVVDLMRERHRGIPRYNDFRQGLHKPRIKRWEDLTESSESVRKLKDIYRDIDLVDTMVGLLAETPPAGFGFSDTAFRIFILMAGRRLQSDRFLNIDFRPEVYSPLGIDWVTNNSMKSVILRHCPELAAFLPRSKSAFAPWRALPEHEA